MYSLVDAQSRHNMSAEFVKANMDDLRSVEHDVADNLLNMVAGELRPRDQNSKLADSSSHPDAYQYYVREKVALRDQPLMRNSVREQRSCSRARAMKSCAAQLDHRTE